MKIVDSNNRFQFIKNQIVSIDKSLPKYMKMKVIEENPKLYHEIDDGTVCDTDAKKLEHPDEELRLIMSKFKLNNIREYLKSKDAEEFNKKFKMILDGEIIKNNYSLQIYDRNWEAETDGVITFSKVFKEKDNLFSAISTYFKRKYNKDTRKNTSEFTVMDLLDTIHIESGKEQEFINKLDGYFTLLKSAQDMHQIAQVDEICQSIVINIYESVLSLNGFNNYITFGNIEKLQSKCDRVIDIDYVASFGRVIPEEIVEKKLKADELCVFDNYCVVYYDPKEKTTKKTAAAKRDPILFGLINHSNKLYYIGSWVDELCDLTLDEISQKIGKEVIEKIDESVEEIENKEPKEKKKPVKKNTKKKK